MEREALFGEVWNQMWGMRNRIAHGYLLIEPAIVRSTVEHDLPVMVDAVERPGGLRRRASHAVLYACSAALLAEFNALHALAPALMTWAA